MKKFLPALLVMFAAFAARAGDHIAVSDLPRTVVKSVAKSFPHSRIIAAKADEKDDRLIYELKVARGDKILRVDVWSNGSIREVESKHD